MKPVSAFCLLLLLLTGATSCRHGISHTISGDYMVIGNAGGFVGPQATTNYFLISGGTLKEDTTVLNSLPPADISGFHFNITLPSSKYATVKNLIYTIPSELLSRNNTHIGGIYPDMGYTDVRTSINGTTYRWYFEGDQSGSSTAIQQFLDSVRVVFQ